MEDTMTGHNTTTNLADSLGGQSTPDLDGQQPEPETAKETKPKNWKFVVERMSYQGIVKNMPYLAFLTCLCVLYIANNNTAISLTRNIKTQSHKQKELKWKYLDMQSELMNMTSESQLIKKTEPLGLYPLKTPAYELKVE